MPYFSRSKIILHHFHVDNNESELGIVYYMIIGRDLMVQLVLSGDFIDKFYNGMILQYP